MIDREPLGRSIEDPDDFLKLLLAEQRNERLEERVERLLQQQDASVGTTLGILVVSLIFGVGCLGAQLYGPAFCFAFLFLVALVGFWLGRD